MQYSLIYKIADYISKNGPIKEFALLRMTDVWGTRYFKDGYISQPFQEPREFAIQALNRGKPFLLS